MTDAEIEQLFPKLVGAGWTKTSLPTPVGQHAEPYNCIAWAAGDDKRWWEPQLPWGYWPPNVPAAWTLDALRLAFESLGYTQCPDGRREAGFEKVVLFVLNGRPTHAARSLPNGKWTSKLGMYDDITHPLHGLNRTERAQDYGKPTLFMKRPR